MNHDERRRWQERDETSLHGIEPTLQAQHGSPGNYQFPTGTTDPQEIQSIAEDTTVLATPELPGSTAVGITGDDGPPMMLLEPTRALMMGSTQTGSAAEMQVGILAQRGFCLLNQVVTQITTLKGWRLHDRADRVRLADAGDGEWAVGQATVPARWRGRAEEHGFVLALYGVGMGSHPHDDGTPKSASERRDMFDTARRHGFVAAALVGWQR